jgi:hypothetical protein
MKKGDFIWAVILLALILFLILDSGRLLYIRFTSSLPYLSGFVKYGILASMGELFALRLKKKFWSKSTGFYIKVLIWGGIGIVITFIFRFYNEGVKALQYAGLLISSDSILTTAFFTSLIMNLTFGIALFISHKITDEIIEYRIKNSSFTRISTMIGQVDWPEYLIFILKMLTFFWIPVHTLVFLLPEVYRVITAAFLSIILGIFLTIGKHE